MGFAEFVRGRASVMAARMGPRSAAEALVDDAGRGRFIEAGAAIDGGSALPPSSGPGDVVAAAGDQHRAGARRRRSCRAP